MKDLFVGASGRLNNHGGSRIFTTPHTINVPPEYTVETDVPSVAEFVTCSLDGRLWVYRRSRRYYVAAFRWNEDTQRLVFVKSLVLSNANIIGRGIDWLLTDTMIIQASDNTPYIFSANLSDVKGSNPINAVDKQFSFLPAIGDWQIIGDYLVRRPEGFSGTINIMPLITDAHYIVAYNGQIWARSDKYIGRCYIFPGALSASGNIDKYCLYVAPCYTHDKNIITDSDWAGLKLFVESNDSLCGFLSEQLDSLNSRLCYTSNTPKIFFFSSGEWMTLPDNSKSFIDTLNNSGVVLDDENLMLLDESNTSYSSKGMQLWVAPAGTIDAVSGKAVISPCNNSIIATHTGNDFHRELLAVNRLPLSAIPYSEKKLSLGDGISNSRKIVRVNSLKADPKIANVAWEDIFRSFVSIELVNVQKIDDDDDDMIGSLIRYKGVSHTVTEESDCFEYIWLAPTYQGANKFLRYKGGNGVHIVGQGIFTYKYWDLDSGTLKDISLTANDTVKGRSVWAYTKYENGDWVDWKEHEGILSENNVGMELPKGINNSYPDGYNTGGVRINTNECAIRIYEYYPNTEHAELKLFPIPDVVIKYAPITPYIDNSISSVIHAWYPEDNEYIQIRLYLLNVDIGFKATINIGDYHYILYYRDSTSIITSSDGLSIYSKYVICVYNYDTHQCAFYRVTISPEIFDILQEIERSKLF